MGPPDPDEAPYGWLQVHKSGVVPMAVLSANDVVSALEHDEAGHISWVWQPADRRLRPVHEVPSFQAAALARDLRNAAARRGERLRALLLFVVSLGIAGWLMVTQPQLRFMLLLVAIVFIMPIAEKGVIGLYNDWQNQRRTKRDPAYAAQAIASAMRYTLWRPRQSRWGAILLIAVLVVLGLMQWSGGWKMGIEELGLYKDRLDSQWWRLLTAALVHGNELHLFFNCVAGYQLASAVNAHLGSLRTWALFTLGAVAGSLLSWLVNPEIPSVGASGGVLALGGGLLGLALRRPELRVIGIAGAVGQWFVLIAVIGIIGAGVIDNAAHAGGALGGVALGYALAPSAARWPAPWSALGFLVSVIAIPALVAASGYAGWVLYQAMPGAVP